MKGLAEALESDKSGLNPRLNLSAPFCLCGRDLTSLSFDFLFGFLHSMTDILPDLGYNAF